MAPQASHRAGFFYFTTKEVFRWLTIKEYSRREGRASPQAGKGGACQSRFPVQDQPTPARAEAPVTEDASKVVTPPAEEKPVEGKTAPTGEQRLRRVRRLPKTRTPLLRLRRVRRSRARTRSRPRSPAWEIRPRWKVVDFTAAGMGRRRASPKRLLPRIRASRRIKRRMRPNPGAAHQG